MESVSLTSKRTVEDHSVLKLETVYQVLDSALKRESREKASYILTTSSNKARDKDDRLGLRIQGLIPLRRIRKVIRRCTMPQ